MFDKLAIFLEAIKGIDQFADEKTKKIQWGLALIKVSGGEVFTTSDIMDFYSFHINDSRISRMQNIVIPTESIFPDKAIKAKNLAEKAFLIKAWISGAFTLGDFVHYQLEYNSITNKIKTLENKPHLNPEETLTLENLNNKKDEVLLNLGTTYLDGVGIAGNFLPLIGEFIDEYVKFAKDLLGRAVQLYVEYKDRINNLMVQMHTELGLSEDEIRRELSGAKNLLACRKEVLALLNSNAMDLLSESDINEIHQMNDVFEDSISELNTKIKEFNRVLDDYAILQSPGVFTEYRFHLETGLIAVSESQETSVQSTTQRYDPLVVDLGGEGFNMKNMDDGVYFDLDMNLTREKTSWVAKEDALLAIDLDANGKIGNGAELFGDHFLMPDNSHAASSIQALSTLDSNKDGIIDNKLFRATEILSYCKIQIM